MVYTVLYNIVLLLFKSPTHFLGYKFEPIDHRCFLLEIQVDKCMFRWFYHKLPHCCNRTGFHNWRQRIHLGTSLDNGPLWIHQDRCICQKHYHTRHFVDNCSLANSLDRISHWDTYQHKLNQQNRVCKSKFLSWGHNKHRFCIRNLYRNRAHICSVMGMLEKQFNCKINSAKQKQSKHSNARQNIRKFYLMLTIFSKHDFFSSGCFVYFR